MPSFSIHTLGCRANQADSERLSEILLHAGFEEVPFGQPADCQIVNTCTVTREADRKSGQMLRRALKLGPQVVATGCSVAQRGGLAQKLPGSALRLAPGQSDQLLALLGAESCPSTDLVESNKRARALLKVQDGCDQFCTFCIVPYVRGRSRSFAIEDITAEARQQRSHELVLTGIHLSAWGRELNLDLADLVERLLQETTARIRLSSVEPDLFPERVFDLMKSNPRVCPHLHLVLQHASNRILERMHRGYTQEHYAQLVQKFVQVPDFCLTTDIMVGFPGETDEDFEELYQFVKRTPFYRIHVFPYSQRPGTAAARFADQVSPEVRTERRDRLLKLAQQKRIETLRNHKGRTAQVLIESEADEPGWVQGTSQGYLTVKLKGGPALLNKLATVTLTRRLGDVLIGKIEGVSA